ncbi:MAG: hypothetical protein ACOYOT_03590 [Bacteroidales bacterium]
MIRKAFLLGSFFVFASSLFSQNNLAKNQKVKVSSPSGYSTAVVDGVVSDQSQWTSVGEKQPSLIVFFSQRQTIGGVHIYFGQPKNKLVEDFRVEFAKDGKWQTIPSGVILGNKFDAVSIAFDATVSVVTDSLRFLFTKTNQKDVTVREITVWPNFKQGIPPLGTEITGYEAHPEPYVPKIYINQSGFNVGKPKRFTAPLVDDGTPFRIVEVGTQKSLFSGKVEKHIGDFSAFEPQSNKEFVILADTFKSFPFRVGQWWIERVTYQNAMNFMIDSRHYVGNYTKKCSGTYSWRDDSHFGWELHTLVPQYLSNPMAYERMPHQVKYQASTDTTLWGVLKPFSENAPDIVKLIHWAADVIVSQKLTHEHFKGQLAYFLYAWPYIKQWMPQQNYDVVKKFALEVWHLDTVDQQYAYNESQGHNMLALKTKIGSTKGALPPGASVIPNLMMYEVAKRDKMKDADLYFKAAYNQVEWMVQKLDWNDPITTKGQRMSEFITMTSLAYMLKQYPEQAPKALKEKINAWADVVIRRSDNMWDFRKLEDNDQWCPTGSSPQQWNETGNIVGFPAAVLSMIEWADSKPNADRLMQIAFAQMDNSFGRNPCGRHCSFDAATEIEGVDLGWYHQSPGGIGQLENARFVLDGSPKNAHYPYHPERGDIGWTEGWISFNTAYNISLTYMAAHDTRWEIKRSKNGVTLRLQAPLNFDYNAKEFVWVDWKDSKGKTTKIKLVEESENSPWFSISLKWPATTSVASYGLGYFKKSIAVSAK